MYLCEVGSNFILLHVEIVFSQHHFLKTILSLLNFLGTLVENQLTIYLRVYKIYYTVLITVALFMVSFDIGKCESSNFVLLCKIILVGLGPLHFQINFRISFPISAKEAARILLGIALNL